MATSNVSPTPAVPATVVTEKIVKYLDPETLAEKKETVKFSFTPAGTYEEAVKRLGSDSDTLLKAVNAFLKRSSFLDVKRTVAAKGINKSVAMKTIAGLRGIFEKGPDGNDWPGEDKASRRKAQTTFLLEMVRNNSVMLAAMKATSAAAVEDEDEDSDSEE